MVVLIISQDMDEFLAIFLGRFGPFFGSGQTRSGPVRRHGEKISPNGVFLLRRVLRRGPCRGGAPLRGPEHGGRDHVRFDPLARPARRAARFWGRWPPMPGARCCGFLFSALRASSNFPFRFRMEVRPKYLILWNGAKNGGQTRSNPAWATFGGRRRRGPCRSAPQLETQNPKLKTCSAVNTLGIFAWPLSLPRCASQSIKNAGGTTCTRTSVRACCRSMA